MSKRIYRVKLLNRVTNCPYKDIMMSFVQPVTLSRHGVCLEPLDFKHQTGLQTASDIENIWKIRITPVPHPNDVPAYIEQAHHQTDRFAFAVLNGDTVVGTTSYHDIVPALKRIAIGYTWYAYSARHTHINTTCKFLLLQHAFETLDANVVGFRTDQYNFTSQKAIERISAKKDGIIRGHALRRDGTIRDTVIYSITKGEWESVKAHLHDLLARG